MDKRLKYAPDYYVKKLSAYAADTVDYACIKGLITYKVNVHDLPVVVEKVKDSFKIYISKKPSLISANHTTRADASTEYYAKIFADSQGLTLDVQVKKWSQVAFAFWFALGIVIGLLAGALNVWLLIIIVFAAGIIWVQHGRSKFKVLVINFLNSL